VREIEWYLWHDDLSLECESRWSFVPSPPVVSGACRGEVYCVAFGSMCRRRTPARNGKLSCLRRSARLRLPAVRKPCLYCALTGSDWVEVARGGGRCPMRCEPENRKKFLGRQGACDSYHNGQAFRLTDPGELRTLHFYNGRGIRTGSPCRLSFN
jgi:hypothetical protein